jgi:hypothetical protein
MAKFNVEISEEQLNRLCTANRSLAQDNEDGQTFEFWDVVEMLDLSDEILGAAKQAGWTEPPDEEEDDEEAEDEDED